LKNGLLIFDNQLVGLTLHLPYWIILKVVAVHEVANVIMLKFVDIKVADRIDSLTLQIIGSFEVAH
jgi:hypothetical protein